MGSVRPSYFLSSMGLGNLSLCVGDLCLDSFLVSYIHHCLIDVVLLGCSHVMRNVLLGLLLLILLLLPLLVHLLLLRGWRRLNLWEVVVLHLGRRALRARVLKLELLLLSGYLCTLYICATSLPCITNDLALILKLRLLLISLVLTLVLLLLLLLLECYLDMLEEGRLVYWLIWTGRTDTLIIDLGLNLRQLRGLLVKIGAHACSLQQLHWLHWLLLVLRSANMVTWSKQIVVSDEWLLYVHVHRLEYVAQGWWRDTVKVRLLLLLLLLLLWIWLSLLLRIVLLLLRLGLLLLRYIRITLLLLPRAIRVLRWRLPLIVLLVKRVMPSRLLVALQRCILKSIELFLLVWNHRRILLLLLIRLNLLLVPLTIIASTMTPLVRLLLLNHLGRRTLSLQARSVDLVLLLHVADLIGGLLLLLG